MILSPDTVRILLKSKHGQEFVNGIRGELIKLDLISQMPKLKEPMEIAVETLARARAGEVLRAMLEPLVTPEEERPGDEDKEVY